MNTNMTAFSLFSKLKSLHLCALDKSSLNIGRVKRSLYLIVDLSIVGNPCAHSEFWKSGKSERDKSRIR